MRKLEVQLRWGPDRAQTVGTLAEDGRRIYFEYARAWIAGGLQLSPFKLPLREGVFERSERGEAKLPGLFEDSLPDGWGLLLMDRAFRRRGVEVAAISLLDRLAYLGDRTMGALTYKPAEPHDCGERPMDLAAIGKNVAEVVEGDAVEVLPQLMRAGGSPAGARPKVVVGIKGEAVVSGEGDLPPGFSHWIVKFPARADDVGAGRLEYAYALMARAAGIAMPESRLIEVGKRAAHFAVRRFDRGTGNARVHVHTLASAMEADFRRPSLDYLDLLRVTQALTKSRPDVLEVVRRMVFNVAAHNRDDHGKNFAFTMDEEGAWRLSPAYDVTFSEGPGGEQTMTVAGVGRAPGLPQMTAVCGKFGIGEAELDGIVGSVLDATGKWMRWADEAGVPKKTAATVRKAWPSLRP